MKKRIGFLLTACTLLFSQVALAAPAPAKTTFRDVSSTDWYFSSVQKLVANGVINGFTDGTFKPNQTVSRSELIKMTATALHLPLATAQAGQPWYTPYVNAAKATGIYNTKDFSSGWDKAITRLETARFAVRAVDKAFKNSDDKQLMYEATKRGIINGVANGELGKDQSSTRAQAAVIIDRMLQLLDGKKLLVDKRAASFAEVELRGTNLETMWGGKMNALPQTSDLSDGVKGTFEQILIIDLDDKESPYRNWVTELTKIDKKSWKGDYLIAFKVTMENTKVIPNTWFYLDMLIENPYFRRAVITSEANKTPLGERNLIELDKKNKVTTWHLVTVSKEDLRDYKEKNWPFWFFQFGNSKIIYLSPEGRIFTK